MASGSGSSWGGSRRSDKALPPSAPVPPCSRAPPPTRPTRSSARSSPLDILRERGNNDLAHEAAGTPPVLIYDYEVVVDGHDLPRPVNYMLLKILPPDGVEIFDWKRPYMIIDPRAGHGAGIGGFKSDSQVGVALRDGHPVYFVAFRPHPEPGQTVADVMRAEAEFVAEIRRRHPDAPKPIVVGNCQGGWATMLLAAANPDITGPLVINGAPLAYWSGRDRRKPDALQWRPARRRDCRRCSCPTSATASSTAPISSRISRCSIPAATIFGKYYDLFADVDEAARRLPRVRALVGRLPFPERGRDPLDRRAALRRQPAGARRGAHRARPITSTCKAIRSPIIVFASWGDNITPPQQALNWIADTYADEHEIRIRGQRIIYMVHEKVGHLGIFVSSSIAKKEHSEVTSTMKTIEAMAPGLYEMKIEEQRGEGLDAQFRVELRTSARWRTSWRSTSDRSEERDFAAVARLSELGTELYDLLARPLVQAMVDAADRAGDAAARIRCACSAPSGPTAIR